ncbi:hypothetical protein [Kocuria rosea]|uniref:hypothetical protein n=1 Tax=Kocuria rosea TaxID=1275 RepID=UPI00119D2126|nr:hypothetical protein [Kocuria rosea]
MEKALQIAGETLKYLALLGLYIATQVGLFQTGIVGHIFQKVIVTVVLVVAYIIIIDLIFGRTTLVFRWTVQDKPPLTPTPELSLNITREEPKFYTPLTFTYALEGSGACHKLVAKWARESRIVINLDFTPPGPARIQVDGGNFLSETVRTSENFVESDNGILCNATSTIGTSDSVSCTFRIYPREEAIRANQPIKIIPRVEVKDAASFIVNRVLKTTSNLDGVILRYPY